MTRRAATAGAQAVAPRRAARVRHKQVRVITPPGSVTSGIAWIPVARLAPCLTPHHSAQRSTTRALSRGTFRRLFCRIKQIADYVLLVGVGACGVSPPPRSAGSAFSRMRARVRLSTAPALGWTLPWAAARSCHSRDRRPRTAGSLSSRQSSRSWLRSTVIRSPSSMRAIGPPRNASGDVSDDEADRTTREPGVGHEADRDVALSAEGGHAGGRLEKFGHPWRASWPSYLRMIIVISAKEPGSSWSEAMSDLSLLNTRAVPTNTPFVNPRSMPAVLTTAPPSGVRFPFKSRKPPVGLNGSRSR